MVNARICPKCHYQRKPGDDHACPEYECPKCGLVYDKFVPPEAASENATEGVDAPDTTAHPEQMGPAGFSIGGKQIVYTVLLLVAVVAVYMVFMKPSGPGSDLAGTYRGIVFLDDETVSVEFDIDEQQRITRILKKQTRELHSGGTYEIEETSLWQYPDIAEVRYDKRDVNDHANHRAYSFKRRGTSVSIEMSDPRGGVRADATFDRPYPENSLPDLQIKKFSDNQGLHYIQFSHNLFETHDVQIDREDTELPNQLDVEKLRKYCPAANDDLLRITGEAGRQFFNNKYSPLPFSYSLSPDFDQCAFRPGYSNFRPQLNFNILPGEIHSYVQDIVDKKMTIDDVSLYTDTTDPTLNLEIPACRLFSRISINSNGYGQFGHPCSPDKLSFLVAKSGQDLSEEASAISTEEWKTVFIRRDPRYKNGTFQTVKKRGQEAAMQAMEKMKPYDEDSD